MNRISVAILIIAMTAVARAQTSAVPAPAGQPATAAWNERLLASAPAGNNSASEVLGDYLIGSDDLLEISVFEVPELSRTVRVSATGEISLPLIGARRAQGLTPAALEEALTEALRETYIKDPQVSVFLREYKSDPVSVVGAVKAPGIYQILTRKSVIEVLAMAQGFSESGKMLPGRTIVITHKNPVAGPDGQPTNVEEVPIKQLLESGDSKWNIAIYPGDVIRVVPAGTFYVAGDVNQPGSFPLVDFDNVSSIQAVAMAGGTKKTAKLKEAVVIRHDAAGNRVEEKLDLKLVLAGKASDPKLGANDILFVPGSVGKEAGLRSIDAAIQVATGILIWGL